MNLHIEMIDINHAIKEVGIELDTWYLIFGTDEQMYGTPTVHVAEYTDCDNKGDPLMWLTEKGTEITNVLLVSKKPLPANEHFKYVANKL